MEELVGHKGQGSLLNDIRQIIEQGRRQAYAAAGQVAVVTYWNIGKRIVEEEQHGAERAQYGKAIIKSLSEELTKEYGKGFGKRSLEQYRAVLLIIQGLRDCERARSQSHMDSFSHHHA